jgi:signal transduction histidine kinase
MHKVIGTRVNRQAEGAMRGWARRVARALLVLGASALQLAWAVPVDQPFAALHHTRWTASDGAPVDALGLAQTPDGALWFGSAQGLFRFDGVRFEAYTPSGHTKPFSDDVIGLHANAQGDLWLGLRLGGACRLREAVMQCFGPKEGLPEAGVSFIETTADGTVWLGTSRGLYRTNGALWTLEAAAWNQSAPFIASLVTDARGRLWAYGLDEGGGVHVRQTDGRWEAQNAPGAPADWLAPDRQQRMWGSGADAPLVNLADPRQRITGEDIGRAGPGLSGIFLFDRAGSLWLETPEGIVRLPGIERLLGQGRAAMQRAAERLPPTARLSGRQTRSWLEDREGNLWITTGGGVDRFRGNRLQRLAPSLEGLYHAAVAPADDGQVWLVSTLTALTRVRDGTTALPAAKEGGHSSAVNVLQNDTLRSVVWTDRGGVLLRVAGGITDRIDMPHEEAPQFPVQAVATDHQGTVWVSVRRKGLYRMRTDSSWLMPGSVEGLPASTAIAMLAEGPRLWLGYPGGPVAVVENGKGRLVPLPDGVSVGNVLVFHAREGRVWVGGSAGVAVLSQGRWRALTGPHGEPFAGVSGLIETRRGELWMNGHAGVTRVDAAALASFLAEPPAEAATHAADRAAPGRGVASETFNHLDGLDGLAEQLGPVPTAVEGSDGRLWFTTTNGAFWIDPQRIARNTVQPRVAIHRVQAGERRYAATQALQLDVGTTALQIDYTTYALSVPERVRFRYRMDGVDAEWQEVGPRREAYYTNLGPGRYRFQVSAVNEDGVPSAQPSSLELSIAPAFYQTGWFLACCAASVVVLGALLYRLRVQRLAAEVRARLSERVQERERIARELHDTLLQGTQGMVLRFQSLALRLPAHEPLREDMEQALDQAELLMAEARSRVQDLRTDPAQLGELSQRIAEAAKELRGTREGAPQVSVTLVGEGRALRPLVAENVYCIAREALFNAFAHASAARVEVEVVYEPARLRLRVRDDGRGLPPEVLATGRADGHWGLPGMQERALAMQAELTLWSRPGEGTELEVAIAAAVAYDRDRSGREPADRRAAHDERIKEGQDG